MIQAIATAATNSPIPLPIATTPGEASPDGSSPVGGSGLPVADELILSQPESLPANNATYQRSSLKIRAHSQVKVMDDGDLRARSHTKLRFRYEFEAADGTRIEIRAKANLNYSQTTDSDERSQSTKLRATARISILQESVSSGVAPLLESPEIATEAKAFISHALDLFQQVVGATTSAFLDSDPKDGDSLIGGLVDAFNGWATAMDTTFLAPPADGEPVSSGEVTQLLTEGVADPNDDPAIESLPAAATSTEPVDGTPMAEVLLQDADGPDHEVMEAADQAAASAVTNGVLAGGDEPVAASESQEVAAAADQHSTSAVSSVMMRVRLQVIQSLSSLVETFDSDASRLQISRSVFRASAQITTHHSVNALDIHDIDTQV
ncbi:MAG: hypothetical protein ACYC6N_03540 [Pirellulaceae bacterium]